MSLFDGGKKEDPFYRKATDLLDGGKNKDQLSRHAMEDLIDHVRNGDVDYIRTIAHNILLKARDEDGSTVLMIATNMGDLKLCKEILKKCPSLLYHQNNYNRTVLHQAIDSFISCGNFLFIDFFVSIGVDDLETSNNERDIYMKFKRWMKMQTFRETALIIAARYGNLHVVKRLVEVDRQYNLGLSKVVGLGGKTALKWAVKNEDHEMVKLLTDDEGDPYCDFVPYSTAMDLFQHVRNGDLDYIKTVELNVLLNSRDQDKMSALCIATECDQLDCCKEILKRCPSLLYHQNNDKWSVLHHAVCQNNYRLIDFYVSAGLEAAKSKGGTDNMIRFKKWINLQNRGGCDTALILAVIKGSHDIVKRFVEVDHQNKLGLSKIIGSNKKTALQWAIHYEDLEMIKILSGSRDPNLDDGANTDDGNFPISIPMQQTQESLQTGNSSGTGVVSESNIFTFTDVSKHNNLKDCWPLINDKVYDVTKFSGDYPGDDEILLTATENTLVEMLSPVEVNCHGGNVTLLATTDFKKVNCHSGNLVTMMDRFYVGECDSITSSLNKLAIDKPQPYSRMQLKEFTKDFSQLLGSGWFGDVYKGRFPDGVFIAVKVLLIDFFINAGVDDLEASNNKQDIYMKFKRWMKMQNFRETALIIASRYGYLHVLKRLFEVDRQYNLGLSKLVGFGGKTALKLAVKNEDHDDEGDPYSDGNLPISAIAMQQTQQSLQTGNRSGTGVVSESNIFPFTDVSKHNNLKDCWPLINDKVHDVTKFSGDHPGDDEILLKATEKNATTNFKKVHCYSGNVVAMMDRFYVGVCDPITSSLNKLASDKPQPYSRMQLKEFTEDFSQLLGFGGFGDVYKGRFPDGVFIAVKVLKYTGLRVEVMEKQFVAEVDTIGRAYHRNLIKLHGYCYEPNTKFKALVYEYMENGSLDKILFGKKLDIPWAKLHNIAKEVAQGISYLHEGCNPRIIHQDIKPSNVLLDSNLSPKVTDFGLAKVVNLGEFEFEQTKIKGSLNYMAPEVNQPKKVKLSCKVDVYSFGMMLFDILGSKRNHVHKRWFPDQVWEKYDTDHFDKFILECGIKEKDKENAKRLATIAFLCVEHDPRARPMLSNVVSMLEGKIELGKPVAPFYPNYSSIENSSMSDSRDYY